MGDDRSNRPFRNVDDEINVSDMLRALWGRKWLVIGITSCFAVTAVIVSLMLPDVYRSQATLAPSQLDGNAGINSLSAQYGGLASLAGINLGGGVTSDKIVIGLEVLKSRKFISDFIRRRDILVPLMAAEDWDSKSRALLIDEDIYDIESQTWVRKVRPPKTAEPSMQEAYERFKQLLFVNQDSVTGIVNVAIEHYSPDIARQWVQWLIEDINAEVMHQDVSKAEQAITYLNEKIANTSLTDLKAGFSRLVEKQTEIVMLAAVSDEYLLRTIDPPVAPEMKQRPKRSIIVIITTLIGAFLGSILVLVLRRPGQGSDREQ